MFKHITHREQLRKASAESKKLKSDIGEIPEVEVEEDKKMTLVEIIEKIEDDNAEYLLDLDFRLAIKELEG